MLQRHVINVIITIRHSAQQANVRKCDLVAVVINLHKQSQLLQVYEILT